MGNRHPNQKKERQTETEHGLAPKRAEGCALPEGVPEYRESHSKRVESLCQQLNHSKGTAHGTLFALHLASPRLAACSAGSAQGVAAHRVVGSTNTCFGVRCSGAEWVVRDNNCSMDRISVSAFNTKTSHSAVRNSSDDRRSRHRSIRDRISSRRVIDRGVMSRGLAHVIAFWFGAALCVKCKQRLSVSPFQVVVLA